MRLFMPGVIWGVVFLHVLFDYEPGACSIACRLKKRPGRLVLCKERKRQFEGILAEAAVVFPHG